MLTSIIVGSTVNPLLRRLTRVIINFKYDCRGGGAYLGGTLIWVRTNDTKTLLWTRNFFGEQNKPAAPIASRKSNPWVTYTIRYANCTRLICSMLIRKILLNLPIQKKKKERWWKIRSWRVGILSKRQENENAAKCRNNIVSLKERKIVEVIKRY